MKNRINLRTELKDRQRALLIIVIIAIALFGTALVLVLTRWGPGLFDWDSYNYLSSAHQLAQGQGLQIEVSVAATRPMIHFPPLFPIVISVFEFFHINGVAGARIFNALLFAVNVGLFAYLVYGVTHSHVFTLVAALLFLLSADLQLAHSWVLSEPLLICITLVTLLVFQKWHAFRRTQWIWLLYGCLALSALTKFVGVAVAPVVALLFLLSELPWKNKLAFAFGSLASGLLPFVAWSVRSLLLTSTLNGRGLSYVPLGTGNLVNWFYTMFTWIFPRSWLIGRETLFSGIGIGLALAACGYLVQQSRGSPKRISFATVFALALCGSYALTVLVAKLFVDHGIGFQTRMFVPLLPWLLLLIIVGMHRLTQTPNRAGKMAAIAIGLYVAFVSVTNLNEKLPDVYENGLGWNRRVIVTSETILRLKGIAIDPSNRLYSNELYGLYFHTGRVSSWLNDFPPQDDTGPTYLIIFKEKLNGIHPLIERYASLLEPVAEDNILAIFRLWPLE